MGCGDRDIDIVLLQSALSADHLKPKRVLAMARLLADQLSVAAGTLQTEPSLMTAAASRTRLLGGVALGGFAGVLVTLWLAGPMAMEASLVRLLHGMVMIKGLIFAAAVALVLRRLAGPVHARLLLGYTVGLGLSAAALAWLWGLSGLLLGSFGFYAGLILSLKTASRDPLLIAGFTAGRAKRGLQSTGTADSLRGRRARPHQTIPASPCPPSSPASSVRPIATDSRP